MLLWLLTSPERASVSGRWAREELEDGTRLELEAGPAGHVCINLKGGSSGFAVSTGLRLVSSKVPRPPPNTTQDIS